MVDINKDKYVLIFDDLERCKISIVEILGFINSFIEQDQIKTIIIANEDEINKQIEIKNYELKVLAAHSLKINSNETDEKKKLEDRISCVFNDKNEYKRYKEKVIEQQIEFHVDYDSVVHELINAYISNTDIKKFVHENLLILTDALDKWEHHNLRTIIFILRKYDVVGSYVLDLISTKEDEVQNKVLKEFFGSLVYESIGFKTQINTIDNDIMNRFIRGFEKYIFIENYVKYSIFNESEVIACTRL